MDLKKINIKYILDYIVVFFLCILAIKKGGFYKSDTILFNLVINILAIILIINKTIKNKKISIFESKEGNLLLLLSISYIVTIIFKNYSSLNDSIFEMIRYFNVYLIYEIVNNTKNKKVYINGIILIGVILCIFGIDQLGNRYMSNMLNKFSSGYLTSNNIDRMSSTIQYANTFALICLIGNILLIEKYKINKNIKMKIMYNLEYFILSLGIILSQSRLVIIIYLLYNIYYVIKNKEKSIILFVNVIYVSIFSFIILNSINNIGIYIYLATFIGVVLNIVVSLLIDRITLKHTKIDLIKYFKLKNFLIIIGILLIYLVIAFSTHTKIVLNSISNVPYITRNMYKIDKERENVVDIEIKEMVEDTRYEIEIFKVMSNNEFTLVDKLYYYSNTTGNFNINIEPSKDLRYINVNINCTKGKIIINKLNVNEKEYTNYLLMPSDLIYRFKDTIHINPNLNYRMEYIKDALKIWKSSIKNILIGVGGEGFRNEYKYFKTSDYNSTEVHNIYIQILLESGIVGLAIFILFIFQIIKKTKFNYLKLSWYVIIVHGIFDLDFSYMIILAIFGILTGLLDKKEKYDIKEKRKNFMYVNKVFNYCILLVFICTYSLTLVILLRANIANCINRYDILENDNLDIIGRKIEKYEKVVNLDNFETSYRFNLNNMYSLFIEELSNNSNYIMETSSYNNMINNMEKNLNYLQKNELINPNNLVNISNGYFNNMNRFVKLNYNDDVEKGYEHYLNVIYSNVLLMYNSNNEDLKYKAVKISKSYVDGLNKLIIQNDEIIKKYKLLLENIV